MGHFLPLLRNIRLYHYSRNQIDIFLFVLLVFLLFLFNIWQDKRALIASVEVKKPDSLASLLCIVSLLTPQASSWIRPWVLHCLSSIDFRGFRVLIVITESRCRDHRTQVRATLHVRGTYDFILIYQIVSRTVFLSGYRTWWSHFVLELLFVHGILYVYDTVFERSFLHRSMSNRSGVCLFFSERVFFWLWGDWLEPLIELICSYNLCCFGAMLGSVLLFDT